MAFSTGFVSLLSVSVLPPSRHAAPECVRRATTQAGVRGQITDSSGALLSPAFLMLGLRPIGDCAESLRHVCALVPALTSCGRSSTDVIVVVVVVVVVCGGGGGGSCYSCWCCCCCCCCCLLLRSEEQSRS
ncbi:MAG TPA: hypothetical protein V6C97_00335, partial [Oculatellaceae cyanobacterium]